ncbi:MAG TPA: class I SAM-dependent methyltransferase [Stellaceae bacterium]|nr:class I SAM-dependent methyltransferase [Stellaceae bacterium]
MHQSADTLGRLFLQFYWRPGFRRILDIGSLDVNGSLRVYAPAGAEYIGIDMASGLGVDVVLDDPYRYPFPDNYFDAIVSTSCFEHDPMFWLTFLEALRVFSPNGFLYINAPSNGMYHSYPTDNWRFYPDAGLALLQWAERSKCPAHLVESFIAGRSGGDDTDDLAKMWNDFVMIFVKGDVAPPPRLICETIPIVYNVRRAGQPDISNRQDLSEDARIICGQRRQLNDIQDVIGRNYRIS